MSCRNNVARLNFSHGSHENHLEKINLIKKVREKLKLPIAVLPDTKAVQKTFSLKKNDRVVITGGITNGKSGNTNLIKIETL